MLSKTLIFIIMLLVLCVSNALNASISVVEAQKNELHVKLFVVQHERMNRMNRIKMWQPYVNGYFRVEATHTLTLIHIRATRQPKWRESNDNKVIYQREKYGDSRRCWIRSMQTIKAPGYGSLSRIIFLLTFVTIAIYFERSFRLFVHSLSCSSATMLFSLEMKFVGKRSQSIVLNSVILHFSCRINRDRVAAGWASRPTDLFTTTHSSSSKPAEKKKW